MAEEFAKVKKTVQEEEVALNRSWEESTNCGVMKSQAKVISTPRLAMMTVNWCDFLQKLEVCICKCSASAKPMPNMTQHSLSTSCQMMMMTQIMLKGNQDITYAFTQAMEVTS